MDSVVTPCVFIIVSRAQLSLKSGPDFARYFFQTIGTQFRRYMHTDSLTIVWIRNDFRLNDNPALAIAAAHGSVLPVHIWDESSYGEWVPGAVSRVWLHHSLLAFAKNLSAANAPFIIRKGDSLSALRELIIETGATTVVFNQRF